MYKKFLFPVVILACLLAFSCQGGKEDQPQQSQQQDAQKETAAEIILKAYQKHLEIKTIQDNGSGNYSVTFTDGTSVSFSLSSYKDGISTLRIGEQEVLFILNDGTNLNFPLYGVIYLEVDAKDGSMVVPGQGLDIPLSYKSEVGPVEITCDASEGITATLDATPGTFSGTLHLEFGENVPEDCKVVIMASNEARTAMRTISLVAARLVVESGTSISFPSKGGEADISFLTNAGYNVSVPLEDALWLSFTETKGMTKYSGVIRAKETNTIFERTSTMTILGKKADVRAEISVRQEGAEGIAIDKDYVVVIREGLTFDIQVTSSSPYEVIVPEDAEWIHHVSTKLTDGTETFSADMNWEDDARETRILFRSGDLTSELTVRQIGFYSALTIYFTGDEFISPRDNWGSNEGLENFGIIDWGDGQYEEFSSRRMHSYENNGEHSMRILHPYMYLTISSLRNIHHIDFSQL